MNFLCLELVLGGEYINEMESYDCKVMKIIVKVGDVIFIFVNCWNKLNWDIDCLVLSMLFGCC